MKEFKKGDRVRVYGNSQTGINISGLKGEVVSDFIMSGGWVNISGLQQTVTVHARQLVKLVKVKPRLERWIIIYPDGKEYICASKEKAMQTVAGKPIQFREVREKKK